MKTFYTYIYYDPTRRDEPFYVGKGSGKRCRQHLSKSDSYAMDVRIAAIRYACYEPRIEVIVMPNEEEALALEAALIAKHGRADLGRGPLLNRSDGGSHGPLGAVRSAEAIEAIRAKAIGRPSPLRGKPGPVKSREWIGKIANANRGRVVSAETRVKQSAAHKGKPGTPHTAENRLAMATRVAAMPPIKCPHCGMSGQHAAMYRWHFDNCKLKPK
jgi:hypothetical protein